MKKIILSYSLLFITIYAYSQNYDYVNEDKGISYENNSRDTRNISIPLYTVESDGVLIPIYLTYNTKGMQTSDIPSSVGFNWKLHAGGGIEKKINHLLDESREGWFFNNQIESVQPGYGQGGVFKNIDVTPDEFIMRMSNGENLDYYYERNYSPFYLKPVIVDGTRNISEINIYTNYGLLGHNTYSEEDENFYQDDNDAEIKIKNNDGVNYLFRKGVKRNLPRDLSRPYSYVDSLYYQNYYIHKITTDYNTKEIDFEYLPTEINKLILHSSSVRHQTNSNQQGPPNPNDPIVTQGFYKDISLEDASRKEIGKISTDKETVVFTYKEGDFYTNTNNITPDSSFDHQTIKLLDEIKVYDHNGKYITGYQFFYTDQTQDPNLYEGDLKIKYILKYGKNHKTSKIYKLFNYNYGSRVDAADERVDVFGYPNGATIHGQCSGSFSVLDIHCMSRMPNLNSMTTGMLKSIVNENGGKKEYSYIENKSGTMYFGGLLIDKITNYDSNGNLASKIEYEYEDPEGYGLPVYDQTQYQQNETPPDVYVDGYYENGYAGYAWQTYFTKIDPQMFYGSLNYLTAYKIKNTPYSLMRVGSSLNTLLNNTFNTTQFFEYKQHIAGAFYKKVTKRVLNIDSNTTDTGYIVSNYIPSLTGFYFGKKLEKIEYFNNAGIKIKEKKYNYEIVDLGFSYAFMFDNVHLSSNSADGSLFRYNLKTYNIYKFKDILKDTEVFDYDNSGILLKNIKKEFTYLNEGTTLSVDYNRIKNTQDYFNGILFEKLENKYLTEYTSPSNLDYLVEKNPLVESNHWIKSNNDWKLKSSIVNTYLPDGKISSISSVNGNETTGTFYNDTNFVSSYYDSSENLISLGNEVIEFEYNPDGTLLTSKDLTSSIQTTYQRSNEYNGLYVDAVLESSIASTSNNFFLRKSFEDINETNVVKFNKAFSGDNVFSGNSISLGSVPNEYLVSYWSYENNTWNFNKFIHAGGNLTITKPIGALYIDELRIQPKLSSMKSYTFKPLIGVSSELDDRGDAKRSEYDLYNRPLYILNKDYNVLKEFRYNSLSIEIPYTQQ